MIVPQTAGLDDYEESQHDTANGGLGWFLGPYRCTFCDRGHIAMIPHVVSDLPCQCPYCHQMTSHRADLLGENPSPLEDPESQEGGA